MLWIAKSSMLKAQIRQQLRASWKAVCERHFAQEDNAFAPPVITHTGVSRTAAFTLLIVLTPWRTSASRFSRDVQAHMSKSQFGKIDMVVALPPPFSEHTEWFAYDEESDNNTTDDMQRWRLGAAHPHQVVASVRAVCEFVENVPFDDVVILGSSQGGTIAAHVGFECNAQTLRRVISHHTAGLYLELFSPKQNDVSWQLTVVPATQLMWHGDLSTWNGQLFNVPRFSRRIVLFHVLEHDDVVGDTLQKQLKDKDNYLQD